MTGIRSPRYSCSHCKHIWIPKDPRPGDVVNCPRCGEFHSKRAGFLKPPEVERYLPRGDPVKKTRTRQLKPYEPKTYDVKSLDMRTQKYVKEKRKRKT